MRDYHFCPVNDAGHIIGPPKVAKCNDDADAVKQAVRLAQGHNIEVWQEARRVMRLSYEGRKRTLTGLSGRSEI
jgi:hypothetical protein